MEKAKIVAILCFYVFPSNRGYELAIFLFSNFGFAFLALGFDGFHIYDCAEFAQNIHPTGDVILQSDILIGHRFFDTQERKLLLSTFL